MPPNEQPEVEEEVQPTELSVQTPTYGEIIVGMFEPAINDEITELKIHLAAAMDIMTRYYPTPHCFNSFKLQSMYILEEMEKGPYSITPTIGEA